MAPVSIASFSRIDMDARMMMLISAGSSFAILNRSEKGYPAQWKKRRISGMVL
jgi:hypothetical protein